jgi:hypothetical protein
MTEPVTFFYYVMPYAEGETLRDRNTEALSAALAPLRTRQ